MRKNEMFWKVEFSQPEQNIGKNLKKVIWFL